MAEVARSVLKGYFETGDKPTQEQFEDLIDSLFSLSDDGGAKIKYLLEQLINLNRLNKSAVRGADFALNRRGMIKWDSGANQITMTNILPGDFWVYNDDGIPTEGGNYFNGDILVMLTSTPGGPSWTLTDTSKFWIIKASKVDEAVTMNGEDTGSVIADFIATFKNDSDSKLQCSEFSISDVFESVKMITGNVNEISATEIMICAGDESRYIQGSGKRIDDSASKGTAILWTSNKFGDAALKNTGTSSGTVAAGDDSRFNSSVGVPNDNTVSHVKLHSSLKARSAVSASEIDWSAGAIFTKTLSSNTTFTFTNVALNKVITLRISGNYTVTLPTECKRISGSYNGTKVNYISIHCINDTDGSVECWYTINQEAS